MFKYISPFVILAIILYILIALLTNLLYYKPIFIQSLNDTLQKSSPLPDISLLFTKIAIILLFILDHEEEKEHWPILFFLISFTGMNLYINIKYNHRPNIILFKLTIILALIVFMGFFTLFIGKVFKFLEYNGSIFLFFLLIVLISFFIFLFKSKILDIIFIDHKNLNTPGEYIGNLLNYFKLVKYKDYSRNYSLCLKAYISAIEESCINIDCPLKDYLAKLKKGKDSQYLLLKYLEKLFKYGISKFRNDPMLKSFYSMFLLMQMNNKEQALIALNSIDKDRVSFINKCNIFRCRKLIDKWSEKHNSYYFNFRMNVNELKQLIQKSTQLHFKFWSLLYESKYKNLDHFQNLFQIGSEIIILDRIIDEQYKLLIKTKTNNIEIFKLYIEFIDNILKNEEKSDEIQNLKQFIYKETFENEEKSYISFNIGLLKDNDASRYILISGEKKDLGTILDCSISASMVFGYTKEELIGNHLNMLIPEIFHWKHNIILRNQSNINNFKLFDEIYQNKEYNPVFKEGFYIAVVKSKFIKNIKVKIYFIKTEENVITFVIEIMKDTPYMNELVKDKNISNGNLDTRCCVLTDEDFLIHSFTANSVEQLGLSYRFIKSNNSIIPYIKQFHDDYINSINEISINSYNKTEVLSVESSKLSDRKINPENISYELKQKLKNDFVNKNYNKKIIITWRINKIINSNKNKSKENDNVCSRISHRGSSYAITSIYKLNEEEYEKEFIMEIKKAILDNKLLGYYFFFTNLNYYRENKNIIIYNSLEKSKENQNEELNNPIKYKTIFKPHNNKSLFFNNMYNKEKKVFNTIINSKNISEVHKENGKTSTYIQPQKIDDILGISKITTTPKNTKNIKFNEGELRIQKGHKYSSIIEISKNSTDEAIIDDSFIPKSRMNFIFDLDSMSYSIERGSKKSTLLKSYLHKKAMAKLKEYNDYIKSLKTKKKKLNKNKSKSNGDSESDDSCSNEEGSEISDEEEEESSSNSSQKNNNIKFFKSITLNDNFQQKKENFTPVFLKSSTLKQIKEEKEKFYEDIIKDGQIKYNDIEINNNKILYQQKRSKERDIFNNYYKVNLNNMHFMIFDFNKDMIVEGSKKEVFLKMENIIHSFKNKENVFNIGKDERYPYISIKTSKEDKKSKKMIEETDLLNKSQKPIINEQKSYERKIKEIISDKKEENPIKTLKKYSALFIVVLILFAGLTLYISLYYFKKISQILGLLKNITFIKYCNSISIYYIRELTLLGFNILNINATYRGIPAKNKTNYIAKIRTLLIELFLESQSNLKEILSSEFSPSKKTKKVLDETFLNSKYFLNNNYGSIEANILSTLIQYNTAFYNIAFSNIPIEQNHTDIYSYMSNGFNNYVKAMDILIDLYNNELKDQKKSLLIIMILALIIIFFVFVLLSILIYNSYISSAKRRIYYMQVFYGININSVKSFISNCELFMVKLKNNFNRKEDEDLEGSVEEIKNTKKNEKQMDLSSNNISINKNSENKTKISLSRGSKFFIFFYLFFILILYSYFPLNYITLYNISNKSIIYSNFYTSLYSFHSSSIDVFNAYREFLFDNQTIIKNMTALEYLINSEIYTHESVKNSIKQVSIFLNKDFEYDKEIIRILNKDLCSFYLTDYYESHEECYKQYEFFLRYDMSFIFSNFFHGLRNMRNIAMHRHLSEYIYGNLTEYDVKLWETYVPTSEKPILFKLDLFNDKELHSEINLLYINIILPYIDIFRKEVLKRVALKKYNSYFSLYFSLFLILILLLYFSFFLPRIRYLNKFIFLTKNLLSLIPLSILASQNNIKSFYKLI